MSGYSGAGRAVPLTQAPLKLRIKTPFTCRSPYQIGPYYEKPLPPGVIPSPRHTPRPRAPFLRPFQQRIPLVFPPQVPAQPLVAVPVVMGPAMAPPPTFHQTPQFTPMGHELVSHQMNARITQMSDTWIIDQKNGLPLNHVITVEATRFPNNTNDLFAAIVSSQLISNVLEPRKMQPLAVLLRIHLATNECQYHACVCDRTEYGFVFASRPVTNFLDAGHRVLIVDESGNAEQRTGTETIDLDKSRVLYVSNGGYLLYFLNTNRCYCLVSGEMLVFSDLSSDVLFRRMFDTKRGDKNESFIKMNLLSTDRNQLEGMTIYHGVVQRDTANDGTFVVTGEGNSILDMTQIRFMMSTDPQSYWPRPKSPPRADRGGQFVESAGQSPYVWVNPEADEQHVAEEQAVDPQAVEEQPLGAAQHLAEEVPVAEEDQPFGPPVTDWYQSDSE